MSREVGSDAGLFLVLKILFLHFILSDYCLLKISV